MLQTYRLKICLLLICLLPTIITAQIGSDIKITFVNSELTKKYFYQQSNLFNSAYDWEILFLNHKITYEVIYDSGLDDFDFKDTDVLILPSVEILSEEAKSNLKEFLDLGGGVFILGRLGEYDEKGTKNRTDFLSDISGIKTNLIGDKKDNSWHLNISNSNILSKSSSLKNLLISNQLPTYYDGWFTQSNTAYTNFILGKYESSTSTIYPAIRAVEIGNGKIVWFGFQLSQISSTANETNPAEDLIFNSIKWLADKPEVWINRFPDKYNSLSLFTFTVDDSKLFTEQILPVLKVQKISSVFLIKPDEIVKSYNYLSELSSYGEIVILYDNLEMLNKFRNEIKDLLIKSIQILKENTQQKSIGVFINNVSDPGEYSFLFEEASFDFFIDNDFSIYLNDLGSSSFRRLNDFEFEIIDLEASFQKDSRLLFDEGFYFQLESSDITNITLPSKNYSGSDFSASEIITEFFKRVSRNNIWVTSYSGAIEWITRKEKMNIKFEESTSENMTRINLSYSGIESAEQVGLVLSLPSTHKNWEAIGGGYPLRYDYKSGLYNILIPLLSPYQTLNIDLRYEK